MRVVIVSAAALLAAWTMGAPSSAQEPSTLGDYIHACDSGVQAACQHTSSAIDSEVADADDYAECSDQFYHDSSAQVHANILAWLRGQSQEYSKPLAQAIDDALDTYYECE